MPAPDAVHRQWVRDDLAANTASLSDPAIDGLYDRAAISGIDGLAGEAWIRILAIDQLMAEAAKGVDTRVNDVEIKKSQRMNQLKMLRDIWQIRYDQEVSTAVGGPVMMGQITPKYFYGDWPWPRGVESTHLNWDISISTEPFGYDEP